MQQECNHFLDVPDSKVYDKGASEVHLHNQFCSVAGGIDELDPH
jgi:hypothetical protein